MSKFLVTTAILFAGLTTLYGQTKNQQSSVYKEQESCGLEPEIRKMQLEQPERYATINFGSVEPHRNHYEGVTAKAGGPVYVVPVVFHILHKGGEENISEAQILDALAILNRDFRRQNADANQVDPAFAGMPTDVEINFVLATKAPNGACFNGITRTNSTYTDSINNYPGKVHAVVTGNDIYQGIWPHNKYLNIIVSNKLTGTGTSGMAYYPSGNSDATEDNIEHNCIFLKQDYCGSIGTSHLGNSRILTHETGHWLNLIHIWGQGNTEGLATSCNIDDNVQDTPNCIGTGSCNLNLNSCNSDDAYWGTAKKDNVENYMDYSWCTKMFTQGQVTRMRTAITSSTGGRNNIWTAANLAAVGANTTSTLCAIDFSATQASMCTGTQVTYSPNTTSGISSYSWSFPGGVPSSSTAQNPVVTYNNAGTYNASLTVTSSSNGQNYSEVKNGYISVSNGNTVNLPFSEGFTSNQFPPAGWVITTPNDIGTTWKRTTTAGNAPTAGNAMRFDNYNYSDLTNDEARLPKLNMSGYTNAQLTFDVAYAPWNEVSQDGLEVLVSTNCGGSFTTVYYKAYRQLATAPNSPNVQFIPTSSQWRNEVIDLSAYAGNASVWIAFRNLSGNGNCLYVDNINVTGSVAPAPTVATHPSASTVCAASNASFTASFNNNPTSYQWQVSTNTGLSWVNVTNGGMYSNATTATLNIISATTSMNGYQFKCTATNVSGSTTSNVATLSVNAQTAPSFSQISAFCAGATAPTLPSTSTNSISGTWSPSTVNNNASGTYTFTPNSGQCATTASMNITVNPAPSATVTPAGSTTFCSGGSVVLNATTGTGLTYQWKVNGTNISGATSASYTATGAGNYTVTVSNGGCSTTSAAKTVTVNSAGTTASVPLTQGFAGTTFPPANWTLVNVNNSAQTWKRSATVGRTPTSGNSMMFDNYSALDGDDDVIRMQAINLSSVTTPQLKFDIAYAPYNGTYFDSLEVLVSSNCGGSYSSVYLKSNTTLATASATTTQFSPTSTQWRTETIGLSSFAGQSNVIVAFKNHSGYGNNLYVDNINISESATAFVQNDSMLGFDDKEMSDILLYPNPSNGSITIDAGEKAIGSVRVFNHLGQLMKEITDLNITKQEVNLSNLADGVYTIRVTTEHGIQSIPVVIEK